MNNHTLPVIVFDVNETLLDMSPLQSKINTLLHNEKGFKIWFFMLLHHSLVDNSINSYHTFTDIADATLQMAAKSFGITTSEEERKAALSVIKELSAHPDVEEGLRLLQEKGFTLATLTNSPPDTLAAQLKHAKLTHFFKATLSIDAVKKYKPAPETYRYAAKELGEELSNLILVAAHGWDIAGATSVGMKAAFIDREGQSLYPLAPVTTYTGKTLVEVAQQIISQYTS